MINDLFKNIFLAFFGFSSGIVVSGGVFAFIAMIGIVPRLAQKTETTKKIPFYEDVIVIGGLMGTSTMLIDYNFINVNIISIIIICVFSLCTGIFVGVLAVSLAEVLNVIPIFTRRINILKGIPIFILMIALGKMVGSFIYFFIFLN